MKSLCLSLLIFLAGTFCRAADPALDMADNFMQTGFYEEAVTEFQRYLFFNPDSELHSEIYSRIGYCYGYLRDWPAAIESMNKAFNVAENDSLRAQRIMDKAVIYLTLGDYGRAHVDLLSVKHLHDIPNLQSRAEGLLLLNAVLRHDWPFALKLYRSRNDNPAEKPDSLEALLLEAAGTDRRSPELAQLLSTILPGLGQFYNGRWLSGLNALILNAALGYLTIDLLVDERYTGSALSFIFLWQRYYTGNRQNAYSEANEYNMQMDNKYEKQILQILQQDD